ncbi:MAG: ABC transporter ATP-binding protein/permease [Rhodocyclaceae bacterium]|nr:ABC transporter ATP-binding protein/permease [Rhodocyclaceae bacterium]MCP5232639.1 ABC transporter ATP-binding protein/permease [Zoogloeaceae bacterium]MCB1911716.1 ABC transporter ATP-binding protein/permease [Rhodocyclaceae bacterium]MCP5240667.1 ABC transporter ATP-binding protein/permease [Zoogloeaceae bacterium]MCP5253220.1 ABC transporter ATP-binding protein/permease [Zoogloeaceae bacterium]
MHGAPSTPNRLVRAWQLAAPFWRSRESRPALALLLGVIGLTLGAVWLNVQFNSWNSAFYNSLQARDSAAFGHQLLIFSGLAAAFIVAAVYRLYLNQLLQMRWRKWMTDKLLGRWLEGGTQYRLRFADGGSPDNPDQRIAEDVRLFVSSTLELSLGLLNAVVTLVSFAGILWALSGDYVLPIGDGIRIPGFMLWAALLYSVAGSWLIHRLGRPLTRLNAEQQRREADFRFGLVRAREHGEAIALSRSEADEQARLKGAFGLLLDNWLALVLRIKRLTWFSSGYGQLAVVFPFLAAAPRYFSGGIELGGLMQTAQAFDQVQGATSWFVDAYASLAEWFATIDRLSGFEAAIAATHAQAARSRIQRRAGADEVRIEDLETRRPDGSVMGTLGSLSLSPGEHTLIGGPSGIGKSTLLRALAGLWPHGSGSLQVPAEADSLFLPQQPYLPAGTLREALGEATDTPDARLQAALESVHLAELAGQLEVRRDWGRELSPGEQQRLAFARILLRRPRWVFLDEATSALDETIEARLYELLRRELPDTTVVSVAHRSSLARHHQRQVWLGASGPAQSGRAASAGALALEA